MAGSVSDVTTSVGSVLGNIENSVVQFHYSFVADASAATIPDVTLPTDNVSGGKITLVKGKFAGDAGDAYTGTAPNTLTVKIYDSLGVLIMSGGAITASGIIVPAGSVSYPIPFTGALTVKCSGNATNSAKAKVAVVVS